MACPLFRHHAFSRTTTARINTSLANLGIASLDDQQLLRYSRHILLDPIGILGQEQILQAHVLIVGVGGLGCPAALYLTAAGVGHLTLADGDIVDTTNLQRQILHPTAHVGMAKALSAKTALSAVNPEVDIEAVCTHLSGSLLNKHIQAADVILDCSDNFETRYAINQACVHYHKPLVSGAALRFDGQIAAFDLRLSESPCYHCLFPDGEPSESVRCATMGVFAPLTGIIGSMQAAEALKIISGAGQALLGQLLLLNSLDLSWRRHSFARDPACLVCGQASQLDKQYD